MASWSAPADAVAVALQIGEGRRQGWVAGATCSLAAQDWGAPNPDVLHSVPKASYEKMT